MNILFNKKNMDNLPDDLQIEILEYVPTKDLAKLPLKNLKMMLKKYYNINLENICIPVFLEISKQMNTKESSTMFSTIKNVKYKLLYKFILFFFINDINNRKAISVIDNEKQIINFCYRNKKNRRKSNKNI